MCTFRLFSSSNDFICWRFIIITIYNHKSFNFMCIVKELIERSNGFLVRQRFCSEILGVFFPFFVFLAQYLHILLTKWKFKLLKNLLGCFFFFFFFLILFKHPHTKYKRKEKISFFAVNDYFPFVLFAKEFRFIKETFIQKKIWLKHLANISPKLFWSFHFFLFSFFFRNKFSWRKYFISKTRILFWLFSSYVCM